MVTWSGRHRDQRSTRLRNSPDFNRVLIVSPDLTCCGSRRTWPVSAIIVME